MICPAAALMIAGCASTQPEVAEQELLSTRAMSIVLEEARADGTQVLLRFRGRFQDVLDFEEGPTFFAAAAAEEGDEIVSALEFMPREDWERAAAGAVPILLLSAQLLDDVVAEVIDTVAPDSADEGAMIRTRIDEIFVYTGDDGEVEAIPLAAKPAHIRIAATYRPADVEQIALRIIERRLGELRIEDRRVLLPTDETGPGAAPFVYIDLDDRALTR